MINSRSALATGSGDASDELLVRASNLARGVLIKIKMGNNSLTVPPLREELGSNMATTDIAPMRGGEPELNLLLSKSELEQPLWKSLFQNLDDFFFPKKQPPLVLTSKPIPVRDIWGFYDYKKNGALGSTAVHVLAVALIIGGTMLGRRVVQQITKPTEVVTLIAPDDIPPLPPAKTQVGGGGGGGDRDKFQAPKGKLPKLAMEQITPPMMVVRNEHPKLAVEPTVVIPPQIKLAMNTMPNLGDPMSRLPSGPPSNGTGSGGGIGSGNGGGVGSGEGPGVGPGHGGGIGGGAFKVGGGVSAPKVLFQPDPEYSEEARKAKYQGTVVLWLVVGPDGRAHDIRVARTLGLGLDEKAMEAVKTWKFEPAMKDGRPVSVMINVEVTFRLY
jgi:TonB family protein